MKPFKDDDAFYTQNGLKSPDEFDSDSSSENKIQK